MAKWQRLWVGCVAGLACAGPAGFTELNKNAREGSKGAVKSITELMRDKTALSDQGGLFSDGCVIRSGVPSRRFVIGAVSNGEAIVAIEHGGRARGIDTVAFRQEEQHWKPVEQGRVAYGVTLLTTKILVQQHRQSAAPVQSY
ncbi:hypothetical protein [Janthinobacterium sp.]|uniref:hypothetical protein n=1 Tax=Janthinobacterium sp. TaxID=1871054 RepID=UPI0025C0895E|nr:hypothetical protein [Janthinobacterium sp.]